MMLFDTYRLGRYMLHNRAVMAPMTRNRATAEHVPNDLMATYYAQRATLGLLITEGTSPSRDGLGYARIPGMFNDAHIAAWHAVTAAVHARGAKIFMQFMHCGRAAHLDNMPAGARVVSSTAQPLQESIYTDSRGLQPASTPHALTVEEIAVVVEEFAHASRAAIAAGFDGIELHAANGYLIEQFLNANVNDRTDHYGGAIVARNRFALEVTRACIAAIGADRVGVRISPYGVFNRTGAFPDVEAQYLALATQLSVLGIVYLHLVDHESMGAPALPQLFRAELRKAFAGTFIASGGFNAERAEAALQGQQADLVAFGRASLANPDLLRRMDEHLPLTEGTMSSFYTPGPVGYTDYPMAAGDARHP
jgi:N-ethylmaleimide reductase